MHYFLCKEKSIDALEAELIRGLSQKVKRGHGVPFVTIPESVDLKGGYVSFSTTALINVQRVHEGSISSQAKEIITCIKLSLENGCKINLHVYSITEKYGIIETGRAELLNEKVKQLLKKERIFPLRKNFDRSLGFVQAVVMADRSVAVSVLTPQEMVHYHSLVSPFVGGFQNIEDNKEAPSRAFKKIVEAQKILGHFMTDGEVVVDLGASPGGWSYVARQGGASVIALDRSELREDLMKDPRVTFIKADAFKYEPDVTIDWVISDIISTPERVMELVEKWVIGKLCTHFVFTIKFHGHENYAVVDSFKTVAHASDYKVIIKQLNVNKNEVTIMGTRDR